MHSLNLTNTVWPHAFHADSTRSFWPSTSDHSPLAGGVKLANSQALVIAPRPERGALRYLCITYWFGGTTLGCKTKIKKLAINYFSRGHSELVSHSWKPPGARERKKAPNCLAMWWTLEYWFFSQNNNKKKKKVFAVSISLWAQIGLLHSCLLPPRLLPARQKRAPVRCTL